MINFGTCSNWNYAFTKFMTCLCLLHWNLTIDQSKKPAQIHKKCLNSRHFGSCVSLRTFFFSPESWNKHWKSLFFSFRRHGTCTCNTGGWLRCSIHHSKEHRVAPGMSWANTNPTWKMGKLSRKICQIRNKLHKIFEFNFDFCQ